MVDKIDEYMIDGQMILPNGEYVSLDDRKTGLNNNVLICGTSGTSKTRNFIIPNLLEGVGSYILTDPKGSLYEKYGMYLLARGYKVYRLSFIHPDKSIRYNPLKYIRNTQDIQKLTYSLVTANDKIVTNKDAYWDDMAVFLINSIIGYLFEIRNETPQTFNIPSILEVLRNCGRMNSENKESKFAKLIKIHKEKYPYSWAVKQYENVAQAPNKTYDTIVSTAISKFSTYDTNELFDMLTGNDLDLITVGLEKTAIFCEISDTDRSMDNLVNTFFTQAMNQLCSFADEKTSDYRLPVPVRFMLDDFASNCRIDNFERMISNIRSRKISACIVVQSLSQLKAGYGENATTIIDNCDTLLFLGSNSIETSEQIALRCNKTLDTILHMPLNHCWIFRRGELPRLTKLYNLEEYINKEHELLNVLYKTPIIRDKTINEMKHIELFKEDDKEEELDLSDLYLDLYIDDEL